MFIFTFFKNINKKVRELDNKATNPFINNDTEYDPLKNAFCQTYIWIEEEEPQKKNKNLFN